jgi:hypothetical protein
MVIVAQYEVLGRSEKTRSVPERTVETFAYLHQGCDKMGRSIGPSAIDDRLFPRHLGVQPLEKALVG